MGEETNPLIPAGYDIVWSVVAGLVIALVIVALVVLARSAKRLTPLEALVWTLVVLFVPVLGPLAWLTIGHRSATPERSS
ncbi:PLD nuclease N-terminal domain-containing protein [Microbacterium sp. SS28]|uniref:PLD nuclease N-terminal domain-containing protein n=1 Tax=Microbacterium sp. SS28 TaxID=2919948 RepID=UPI001FAAEFE6|nr:PLD nuclease N-terminal domain-containing protein [Microbacterium sp. SS28]